MISRNAILSNRRAFGIVLGVLLLLTAGLHFGFLERHSLWNDEFITLRVIGESPRQIIEDRLASNHVPGYFLGLWAWCRVAGTSEVALRFPSAVFSILGILVVWRLGAYLFGERMGLLVLLLAGANQFLLEMSSNARMYSGVYFTVAWALSALIRYLDSGKKRHIVSLSLAGILGIALHMLHLFAVVGAVIYVAAYWKRVRHRVAGVAVGLLTPLLIWIPLLLAWSEKQSKVGLHEWGEFRLFAAIRQATKLTLGDYGYADSFLIEGLVALASVSLVAVWIARATWRHRGIPGQEEPVRHLSLLWIWFLLPPVGVTLGNLSSGHNLVGPTRYFVSLAPAAPLLLVETLRVLSSYRSRRLSLALGSLFVVATIASSGFFLRSPGSGLREIIFHLSEHVAPEDIVVTSRKRARTRAFEYYGLPERPDDEASEARGDDGTMDQWLRQMAPDNGTLWVVFYGDAHKSRIVRIAQEHPDVYVPLGPMFEHGDTAVRPFRVHKHAGEES